jgi:hypothetical protein
VTFVSSVSVNAAPVIEITPVVVIGEGVTTIGAVAVKLVTVPLPPPPPPVVNSSPFSVDFTDTTLPDIPTYESGVSRSLRNVSGVPCPNVEETTAIKMRLNLVTYRE